MRWRPLVYFALSLAAVAGALAAAPTPPVANPNEPIVTRQNAFSIPFRIDRTKAATEQPVEVELRVSSDRGANWQLYGKAKPEQANFVFRAPHDGEFWFSLRTLDKQGKARPDGAPQPELKVVVDTVPPRFDLTATRGPGGEVTIGWQAVDPNLKPETLKIEVQSIAGGQWEIVNIDASPPANRSRHTLTGQTTFWPKQPKGPLTVRAQISDLAGNQAASQIQPTLEGTVSGDKTKGAPPTLIDPKTSEGANSRATSTAQTGAPPASTLPGSTAASATQPKTARQWPADAATSDTLARRDRAPSANGQAPADANRRAAPAEGAATAATPAINASTSLASSRGKAPAANADTRRSGKTLDFNLLPPGEHPRMVNARSFDLEYEVDAVGTSGIAKVEVWGTRDGGRTWSSFGLDSDNRSPARVNVDTEGIYGFRIVVQSGSGLGGLPPRDGELPEIWVGVDLTRPTAKITSATVQPESSELLVRWEASDELPDVRPITLSFSDRANGPWTPIAAGLENTGAYSWRLDSRAPDRIFLRLEARDEAGNVGTYVTTEPVSLDRQRPQGRIRGIRPVGEPAR